MTSAVVVIVVVIAGASFAAAATAAAGGTSPDPGRSLSIVPCSGSLCCRGAKTTPPPALTTMEGSHRGMAYCRAAHTDGEGRPDRRSADAVLSYSCGVVAVNCSTGDQTQSSLHFWSTALRLFCCIR